MPAQSHALDFLYRHGMIFPESNLVSDCDQFLSEISRGLRGEASSLLMLPTYLSLDHSFPEHGQVVAIDAGGTNFRMVSVQLDGGKVRESDPFLSPMPGSLCKITKEEFLDFISGQLAHYPEGSSIGFCFSFPTEITPDLDGIILLLDKEVKIEGGAGTHLIRDLSSHMKKSGAVPPSRGAVINDTVASLLGGYLTQDRSRYDGWIGFILGTGINCCYSEKTDRIPKVSDYSGRSMILNMESGGYSGFCQGDFDRALDACSSDPGEHCFEKMVSGAYLGSLILLVLKGASEEGLFSPGCAEAVTALDALSLSEISLYMNGIEENSLPGKLSMNEIDCEILDCLLDALLDRAAAQIAISLTATLIQGDMGKSQEHPAAIMVEGSTFHKFLPYQKKITDCMKKICTDTYHRYWTFLSAEGFNLRGAAAAALLLP